MINIKNNYLNLLFVIYLAKNFIYDEFLKNM